MGPTNIHHASALLNHAGSDMDDQATIMPFGIGLYNIFQEFSQSKLDKYGKMLNDLREDLWLEDDVLTKPVSRLSFPIRGNTLAAPPQPVSVPKACISPGLAKNNATKYIGGKKLESEELMEPLHFILIVQGREASAKWKILCEDSLRGAAYAIMSEALNRYSVVFSGALLQPDLKRLQARTKEYEFTRVGSVAELNAIGKAQKENTIGILC